MPWALPIEAEGVRLQVTTAHAMDGRTDADVLVVIDADRRTSWPEDVGIVALPGPRVRLDQHLRAFTGGPANPLPTPYGRLRVGRWHLVHLTTRGGDAGDEQGYWLPRAFDERTIVVTDGPAEHLQHAVEPLTTPFDLPLWFAPGSETPLPNGPRGTLHLDVDPPARVALLGTRIEVRQGGTLYTLDRGSWSTRSDGGR